MWKTIFSQDFPRLKHKLAQKVVVPDQIVIVGLNSLGDT